MINKNNDNKIIRFLDENNEHIYEEPADFISANEMIPTDKLNIEGGSFFGAIKSIFPVLGLGRKLLTGIFNKKKEVPMPELIFPPTPIPIEREEDINGGFLPAAVVPFIPLIASALPTLLDGLKGILGNGLDKDIEGSNISGESHGLDNNGLEIHRHDDDIYGLTYNKIHHINPCKFNEKIFNIIGEKHPQIPLHDYKVQLIHGSNIEYEKDIRIPLAKHELHLFNHILGKGVGSGIGSGIGRNINSAGIGSGIGRNINSSGIGRNINSGIGRNIDNYTMNKMNKMNINGNGFNQKVLYNKKYNNVGEIL
jgi:hypothetical protein